MALSPTQLTLREVRKQGLLADVAESWNAFSRTRRDLFGWMDICYLRPDRIVGVQCTSGPNHAARRRKLLGLENVRQWIISGGIVEVWSWTKKKGRWSPRIEVLTLGDFDGTD